MSVKEIHNRFAPFWAGLMILFLILGLITINSNINTFLNGYLLDMVGPGWCYILFRGLFTNYSENRWRKIFTPMRSMILLLSSLYLIETLQYFELYQSTFDPLDLVAYSSIIIPISFIDLYITKKR